MTEPCPQHMLPDLGDGPMDSCPECRHALLLHPGSHNEGLEACMVCLLVGLVEQVEERITHPLQVVEPPDTDTCLYCGMADHDIERFTIPLGSHQFPVVTCPRVPEGAAPVVGPPDRVWFEGEPTECFGEHAPNCSCVYDEAETCPCGEEVCPSCGAVADGEDVHMQTRTRAGQPARGTDA